MHEYQYTADGRIRDRSRNVLTEHAPDYQVVVRIAGQRKALEKSQILALEWFDTPPRADCCVCGKGPRYRVIHLDGNRQNFGRDNLKWAPDPVAAHRHERDCLRVLIQQRPRAVPWGRVDVAGVHAPECQCARCGGSRGV
jgi:hypothetical protein